MNQANSKPRPLSRRKRILFALITITLTITLIGLVGETLMRWSGFKAWTSPPLFVAIDPPGPYFRKHPTRGFAHVPGRYRLTLEKGYSFTVTHDDNGLRITRPITTPNPAAKKPIWIFGCSFTHGFSVSDEETYPWILQSELPDYEVVNFGTDGYGTVQSLIQFRETLKDGGKPAIVVVAYASFHDMRNAMTRTWRKDLSGNNSADPISFPYARLSSDGKLVIANEPLRYPGEFLLRHSALLNYLDDRLNSYLTKRFDATQSRPSMTEQVSRAVLEEFRNECKAEGIPFVLAGISYDPRTAEMLAYFQKQGMSTVDISVDSKIVENTNYPFDVHPSFRANIQSAQKLRAFLAQGFLLNKPK